MPIKCLVQVIVTNFITTAIIMEIVCSFTDHLLFGPCFTEADNGSHFGDPDLGIPPLCDMPLVFHDELLGQEALGSGPSSAT